MKVRYTRRAAQDLEAIFSYLDARAPAAARSVKALIELRISRLAEFPRVGRVLNETGVRELVVVRYPYKVYDEIAGDEIRVLHIRDARRRPWQNN
jgi:toxin ParE1/3/4